MTSHLAN